MFAPLINLGMAVPVLASFATVAWGILAVVLVLVCLLLIAVILIQDPKGGGLTSAFGAAPGGDSVLGARAQRDVTIWTSWLTLVFLVVVVVMVLFDPDKWQSAADEATGSSVHATAEPEMGAAPVDPLSTQPDEGATSATETPSLAPTGTDDSSNNDGGTPSEPATPADSSKSGQ